MKFMRYDGGINDESQIVCFILTSRLKFAIHQQFNLLMRLLNRFLIIVYNFRNFHCEYLGKFIESFNALMPQKVKIVMID